MASVAREDGGWRDLGEGERERLVRKIKRCLALSQSANPNEAQTALRQAHAMMRNYRLTLDDLQAQPIDSHVQPTGLKRMPRWQRKLAALAAQTFECKVLTIESATQGGYVFEFVGRMPAATLAAYAYDALLAQIKKAKRAFITETNARLKALEMPGLPLKKKPGLGNDFCEGWILAVTSKMTEFAQAHTGERPAMVMSTSEEQAILRWIAAKYPHAQHDAKRSAPSAQPALSAATKRGFQSGQQAHLHQAIHATAEQEAAKPAPTSAKPAARSMREIALAWDC